MADSVPVSLFPAGAVRFAIQLTDEDLLDGKDVADTSSDARAMLSELERSIAPDGKARAHWEWAEPDPILAFAASANGATAETLLRVVTTAHQGFKQAASGSGDAEWPPEFTPAARARAQKILRRITRVQSMVIEATERDPFTIDAEVTVGERLQAKPRSRRSYSSVDGVLKMLSGRETVVRAGLREHRTNNYVICTFDATTWGEKLGRWWNHRVVVEGMVAYNDQDRPTSIVDVRHVQPKRTGVALTALEGIAPSLTGGLTAEEFVAVSRKHG